MATGETVQSNRRRNKTARMLNAGRGGESRNRARDGGEPMAERANGRPRSALYKICIYEPRETFRMHIRLERWPTIDFRRSGELTFALLLYANSHKDPPSLSTLLVSLVPADCADLCCPFLFSLRAFLSGSCMNVDPTVFVIILRSVLLFPLMLSLHK